MPLLRPLSILLLALATVPGIGSAQSLSTLVQRASSAEDSGRFADAARLYERAYAVSGDQAPFLYMAALSSVRAGRKAEALASLRKVVASGFPHVEQMAKDTTLAPLHGDPRWAALLADARARYAAFDLALRSELLELAERDQRNRAGIDSVVRRHGRQSPQADSAFAALDAADAPILGRLLAIVRERGWPGRRLVADDGAHAAWLILQHAPAAEQKRLLPLLWAAARRGDARLADAAYLDDRVRTGEGRPQRYGTQLRWPQAAGESASFYPLESPACVDRWRAEVGMEPLADYARQMGVLYSAPAAGRCSRGAPR